MHVSNIKISDLKPFAKNPKHHPPEQLQMLKKSMQEFGWTNPILVAEDNMVVAGHARLQAATELNFTEVPTIKLDMPYEKAVAYVIADNRLAELAETDNILMSELLSEVIKIPDFDFEATGYTMDDLDDIINEVSPKEIVEDVAPGVPGVPVCVRGDIWELGRHRLMCGDSTLKDDVDMLMGGVKADMCFTDPPYNMTYQDMAGKFDEIKNDKMSQVDFKKFLLNVFENIPLLSYICCNWMTYGDFFETLEEAGKPVKSCIVWDKVTRVQNLDKYYKQHEFILYTGKLGGEETMRGDVWEFNREKSDVHPTMKPIGLVSMALEDNPKCRSVLDLFGGSGSTLIACEQTNRINYSMELDEHYCDVIIQRYVNFTGNNELTRNGEPYTWSDQKE